MIKTYWREYDGDEKTVVQISYFESLLGSGIERKTWSNLEHLSLAQNAFLKLFENHLLQAFELHTLEQYIMEAGEVFSFRSAKP